VSERPLVYTEFAPGDTVRDIALTYFGFMVRALPYPGFVHRVLPDGCVSLTLASAPNFGVGAHVLGVCNAPLEVPLFAGARYWGVRFRPEAGAPWLGVPAADLRNQNISAAQLLGDEVLALSAVVPLDDAEEVRVLLDAWIASRPFDRARIDTVVRSAVAAIVATDGRRAIADIARDVGVSPRALQRRFSSVVGLPPKTFAVLRRARHALKRLVSYGDGVDPGGLSGVAHSSGYADQAHFTREVVRLTRFAPTALRARLDSIEHGLLH
jgi:AraC-like DNA-binding protein